MTERKNCDPNGGTDFSEIYVLASPILIMMSITLPFVWSHHYNLMRPECLILVAGTAATGLAAGLAARLRRETVGTAIISFFASIFIVLRSGIMNVVYDGWAGKHHLFQNIIRFDIYSYLIITPIAIFIFVSIISYIVRRHIFEISTWIFSTIIISSIFISIDTGDSFIVTGHLPAQTSELPPIIHIILDEHIAVGGIPDGMEESENARAAIVDTYHDFAIYTRAYSRFSDTPYSLASLFAEKIGNDVKSSLDIGPLSYRLLQNSWFTKLKKSGYAVSVYQSAYFDMCSDKTLIDKCLTYPLYSVDPIQRSNLGTTDRVHILLLKLLSETGGPFKNVIAQPSPLSSMEALGRLERDVAQHPHGVAFVAHLLLPHFAHLYDKNCEVINPSEWTTPGNLGGKIYNTPAQRKIRYRRYLSHLICVTKKVNGFFAHLKRLGIFSNATIVVHGDHGSRIAIQHFRHTPPQNLSDRDTIDLYSTLLAVKAPGLTPGIHPKITAMQDFFGAIFLRDVSRPSIEPNEILMEQDDGTFAATKIRWPSVLAH